MNRVFLIQCHFRICILCVNSYERVWLEVFLSIIRYGFKTSVPAGAGGWMTPLTRSRAATWVSPQWSPLCPASGSWVTWCPRPCRLRRSFRVISSAPLLKRHLLRPKVKRWPHKWPRPTKVEATSRNTCRCIRMECFHLTTTANETYLCVSDPVCFYMEWTNLYIFRKFFNKVPRVQEYMFLSLNSYCL